MTAMDHAFDTTCLLYLGTEDGLRVYSADDSGLTLVGHGLDGEAVRAIDVNPDDPMDAVVGCGLRGWGLYRTTDGGETFDSLGFDDEWVWGIERHPTDPETVYVGTEPPALSVSTDSGQSFRSLDGIDDLPSRPDWSFFHDPFHAGHVHGIDTHSARPEFVVAGVEHGALIHSKDGGETFQESLVGADVHRVAIHPNDPDRVFAATGSGLYCSEDACNTWTQISALEGKYLHSILFHDETPDLMTVYAASEDEPLFRSEDGGQSWRPLRTALPEGRAADNLTQHPVESETLVYAGDPDRETSHLFVSADGGHSWQRLDGEFPKVWRVAVVPAN